MKKLTFLTILLLTFSCVKKQQIEADYVITNANIIPILKDTVLKNKTLAINDNKIVFIGENNADFTGNPQKIDAKNGYILPGLSDMHVHFPKDGLQNIERNLLLFLANGVTNIRSMEGDFEHLKLKEKIKNGGVLAPAIQYGSPRVISAEKLGEQKIDSFVALYKKSGFDFIKVVHLKGNEDFDFLLKAGKKHQITLNGHAPANVDFNNVVNAKNYTSVEHLGGYEKAFSNAEKFKEYVTKSKENNIYSVATLDYFTPFLYTSEELLQRNGLQYLPKEKENWTAFFTKVTKEKSDEEIAKLKERTQKTMSHKQTVTKALFDSGVQLLIGPDASGPFGVAGFNVANEMKLHTDAGISNYDVLKIATLNRAKYQQKEKEGTVKVGNKADIILVDKNPLENIENLTTVSLVFVNGKPVKTTEILKKLATYK